MLTSLTVPVAILLLGLPGLGIFSGFRVKPRHVATAVDSLPPAWKPASRLALENQFVRAWMPPLGGSSAMALKLQSDPRRLRVSLDADSGAVSTVTELGDVRLGMGARQSMALYAQDLTQSTFQRQWAERSRQSINSLGVNTPSTVRTGLQVDLPVQLPGIARRFLGPGGPALNVSGSENIRLSGTSNWSNQQTGPLGQKKSLFPSLDMQQDLDIRLEGQLSDRVKVNLLQNSGVQIPLANRIAINYKGDEDDLVQQLDLGNTNLTLPGTQYVSYSGKNEGLFGVKATTRMGPLDFTILTSKQEGRSERANYAGGASKQSQSIRDHEYIKGTYFLLYDPNGPTYEILDSSIQLYLDDADHYNDAGTTVRGKAVVDPLAPDSTAADSAHGAFSFRGTFEALNPGPDQDYEILTAGEDVYGPLFKVIRLRRPMNAQLEQALAVTYSRRLANSNDAFEPVGGDVTDTDGSPVRLMKLLWAPSRLMKSGTSNAFDTTLTLTATRDLELRNFYQLPGQRIDPASLKISIRKGVDQPPRVNLDTPEGTTIPYIEVFGLDNFDESSGNPVAGHDAKVDGTYATTNTRLFVDTEKGILFFYEPRPFAPRLWKPFERQIFSNIIQRRATVFADPTGPNPNIYDNHIIERDTDTKYWIDVEFNAARAGGEINLGRSNLVEGSDVVTINGQALVRDRDYTVDYDLGRVVLKRQLGPADQLNVDYSYAPLFAQAGKTLLGSAFRLEGRDKSLGGAFMYESKGAQDLRPRLGEEPSRSLIADLNTDWSFTPDWITRMVDRLPGVRTATTSEFKVQAEMGASFPNPNTRNEVYIDDMEGVRDAVSVSTGPDRWRLGSVPSRPTSVSPGGQAVAPKSMVQLQTEGVRVHNAEVHWYSPYSVVKEIDLKPNLEEAEGAQNSHQVLALSVPRRPLSARNSPGDIDSLWVSMMYPLDQSGLDLSKSQFIELWVNDFFDVPRIRDRHVRLHVDVGVVSENQMRSPDAPPNLRLDTEDRERDNQLIVTEGNNEDTGVDGWLRPAELDSLPLQVGPQGDSYRRDLVTSSEADPEGDDFQEPDDGFKELDPRRFRFTNGIEANKTILPYPDTEDLNLNNRLDTNEDYFEYTIDLGDTTYLETDVRVKFAGDPDVKPDNGWRRYRIPIGDPGRVQFGVPDLTLARHVRLWVEGLIDPDQPEIPAANEEQRPILMIGGLEIVGSRWRAAALDTAAREFGTTLTLNAVNSVDNADIYEPPFDPGETRSGSQGLRRREQSIALEFTELPPDSSVEAFKTFSIDENYSRYGNLNWYVTGFDVEDDAAAVDGAGLEYFVRFASDEQGSNYYEYRAPLPVRPAGLAWQNVNIALTELSGLKLLSSSELIRTARSPGSAESLVVVGRPSFTRLRRVSFGVVNHSGTRVYRRGQIWFNELRATEVAKDRGQAQRVLVNGNLANLFRYNVSWNGRNADFLSVGESRGSGSSTSDLSFQTTFDLHRFFEGTGIVLPISFGFFQRNSTPRFTAGDDVVRTGALAQASETFSDNRNWAVSYQRNWSDRSPAILRYTLGGLTAQASGANSHDHNPNNLGRGTNFSSQVNYQISPRNLLALRLPATKIRFYPLPERFFWNYSLSNSSVRTSDLVRSRTGDTITVVERAPVLGRQAFIRFGADSRPFELFQHSFSAERNLRLADPLLERVGFVNFGKVVRWNQTMSARYGVHLGNWLRPNLQWRSSYNQENGPELSPDLSLRAIRNSQSVTMTWSLPFEGLAARAQAPRAFTPMPRAPEPGDSAGVVPPAPPPPTPRVALWRNLLSRLGSISTDAAVNWNSAYSRMTGTPGLPYLLGITRNPEYAGRGVGRRFGNADDRGFDWKTAARTRLSLGLGASLTTSAELSAQQSDRNNVALRKQNMRFPDFQVDYGRVASAIGLQRLLQNPRLKTSYNNSRTSDYNGGRKNISSTSSQWQPMLGIEGELKNGARLQFSLERRSTKRELFQLGKSEATDNNTDINFSINRSYSQGQKVSILGKQSTVKSTVNIGLATVYSRQTGQTIQNDDTEHPLYPTKRDRLSLNGTGSYGFSTNVTGNLNLGFVQNRDLVRDIVNRSVRVELAARFSF